MDSELKDELLRLTANSAIRREHLLLSGLYKSRLRKALNITAGVLALLSAGAISTVIVDIFGDKGIQIVAALVAGISGTLSLVITAYFSDDEIVEIMAVICMFGFLNRWNDTMASGLEAAPQELAERLLAPLGWDGTKHTTEAAE